MKKLLTFIILLITLISCTDNERARYYGGEEVIKLKKNEKFINLTWKEADVWVIVQDTVTGKYYAREKSSFGVMEGKIIIE